MSEKSHDASLFAPPRLTMSTQSGISVPDTNRPTFDPGLDVATLVFSHAQCVKTRVNLAMVSRIWRDASKTADAYPLRFNFDALPHMYAWRRRAILRLLDNDEALSLPYERVVVLLGEAAELVCEYSTAKGSVRLLKWTQENNHVWSVLTCRCAAHNGHLDMLKYLHENGCPWDRFTCYCAVLNGHWDCLQYAVDNKCPKWEYYAEEYAKHLR